MQELGFNSQIKSVKELSSVLGISTTTLRNWESYFVIAVDRDEIGNRKYSENSIRLFKKINSYVKEGLKLKEIKPLLNMGFEPSNNQQSKIEFIQDEPEESQKYDLILKPFINQITEYKTELKDLRENYSNVIQESATLKERVKNKDEIISFLQERLNKLESKRWYQVWR